MARITKAALEQQVVAQQARIAALEAECEALRAEAEAARTPTRRITRAGYVAPAWQAERAAQMAAARELAMRIGRSVKVA